MWNWYYKKTVYFFTSDLNVLGCSDTVPEQYKLSEDQDYYSVDAMVNILCADNYECGEEDQANCQVSTTCEEGPTVLFNPDPNTVKIACNLKRKFPK